MTAIEDIEKPVENSKNDSTRGLFKVLSALAWAIVPTAIFSGLLGLSFVGSANDLVNQVVLLIFIFPAALIYEALGLGTFNILSSAMPVAMWPIMITLAYIYGLVLVLIVRGLWRLIQSTAR